MWNKQLLTKYHLTIGEAALSNGFNRQKNLYYRIHGDDIFQIINFIPDALGGTLYVDMYPLYSRWTKVSDSCEIDALTEFEFKAVATECYGLKEPYEELEDLDDRIIDFMINSFFDVFQETVTPEDLYTQRELLNRFYDTEETDLDILEAEKEEELRIYSEDPRLHTFKTTCVDDHMAYIALKLGKYNDATNYIDYSYRYLVARINARVRSGQMDEETSKRKISIIRNNKSDMLKINKMIDCLEYNGIQECLRDNITSNMDFLNKMLHIDKKK